MAVEAVVASTDIESIKAAQIGMKAVGAIAENKDFFGLGLLFTVIPETIVIFGLVVGLLLLF